MKKGGVDGGGCVRTVIIFVVDVVFDFVEREEGGIGIYRIATVVVTVRTRVTVCTVRGQAREVMRLRLR